MASNAYAALGTRLVDIDELMNAHAAVGGTQRGRRFDTAALNRASVLLLSAHLEGYLEELMAEAIDAIHTGLTADTLTSRFANPSVPNIDKMFAFLGLAKPCNQVSWRNAGNAAVKKNINELATTRNRIAHGSTGVSVSKVEVTRYRTYVQGFAKAFDNIVCDRIAALMGTAPWTRLT